MLWLLRPREKDTDFWGLGPALTSLSLSILLHSGHNNYSERRRRGERGPSHLQSPRNAKLRPQSRLAIHRRAVIVFFHIDLSGWPVTASLYRHTHARVWSSNELYVPSSNVLPRPTKLVQVALKEHPWCKLIINTLCHRLDETFYFQPVK